MTASELAARLKQYIPNGDGYNSDFARDMSDAVEYLEKLSTVSPVGFVSKNALRALKTGGFNRITIRPEPDMFAKLPLFEETK